MGKPVCVLETPPRAGRGYRTGPAGLGRLLVAAGCLLCLLAGCAGKSPPEAAPKPSGFASADAKNIHDFIARYPDIAASGDAKAMLRLFTEDARYVPLLGNAIRPIRAGELPKQLPTVMAEEKRMGLRLTWREPMDIQAKGERGTVRVVADLAWKQSGQAKQAVMSCFFGLVRDDHLLWRIREFHGEPVGPDFRLPAKNPNLKPLPAREAPRKTAKKRIIKGEPPKPAPAAQPAPAPQPAPPPEAEAAPPSDGSLVPINEAPKPLF
ncbi:Cif family virulence factor [Solidesulfovibrio sp.]